ncbi:DEAD/DEAH box helicase [Pseudalkalibacillus caeni]|uniref:DEAD/DEAH box helicase n=1 Tax=Exobacillus caeni TaxID=2574798 RepID=UPI00319E8784
MGGLRLEDQNSWSAIVYGSDAYHVDIELLDHGVEVRCNCQAFESYGPCKHIAATMLNLSDRGDLDISSIKQVKDENPITAQFIETFSAYEQSVSEGRQNTYKAPLHIEYVCKGPATSGVSFDSVITLELRAGENRPYIIKNIGDFLESIKVNATYRITNNFTFDPTEHYLETEDKEIFDMLYEAYKNEQVYKDSFSLWARSTNARELVIPPLVAKNLFPLLKERPLSFELQGKQYTNVDFVNEELPFIFQLTEKDGVYEFDFDGLEDSAFFDLYGFLFYQGVLYNLSLEQKALLREFSPAMMKEEKLTVTQKQMEPFISTVLPGLERLGNIEISQEVSEKIIAPQLQTKIFVQADENRIEMNVEYHYGETVIHPFKNERSQADDTILQREADKEREIMQLIENAGMKFNGKQLYVNREEEIFDFLFYTLPELEEKAEVFVSGDTGSLIKENGFEPMTTVDLDVTGNWLDITFDFEGIDQNEVQNILTAVVEKKRYYRLPEGTFVSFETDEMEQLSKLMREFHLNREDVTKGKGRLPIYRGPQLEEMMNLQNPNAARLGKAFQRLVDELKNPAELNFELPEDLNAELRDYQKTGFKWLKSLAHYNLGGILADDMGLGKTLQSIAYILSEKQETKDHRPTLVVAPASLIYNWKNEFEKFAPVLDVQVIAGTPSERVELLWNAQSADVWITSYPLIRQDIDSYVDTEFNTLILDEAQAVKNPNAKTTKAARKINAHKRFALSGTPIENSIGELWSLMQIILPGFFPSQAEFRGFSQEKIAQMVNPFILRRVKKDVLKELPDKIETMHISELTKNQKELYLGYLQRIQQETVAAIQDEGFQKSRIKILAGLTRLRQLCCHPSLFVEDYKGKSGKLEQLMDLVQTARENGQRLLVFSQFASMLRIIRDRFEEEGLNCFYLDGQTPSQDRVEMVERFNEGEKDIFLVSLKAGGTGLNLTGADTVILYDLWWNPAVEEQAAGRAHRIGQKKVVQVMRLIAKGTIEEKIYDMQQKKKELIEAVIKPGETMLSSLSEDEIRSLLSI